MHGVGLRHEQVLGQKVFRDLSQQSGHGMAGRSCLKATIAAIAAKGYHCSSARDSNSHQYHHGCIKAFLQQGLSKAEACSVVAVGQCSSSSGGMDQRSLPNGFEGGQIPASSLLPQWWTTRELIAIMVDDKGICLRYSIQDRESTSKIQTRIIIWRQNSQNKITEPEEVEKTEFDMKTHYISHMINGETGNYGCTETEIGVKTNY